MFKSVPLSEIPDIDVTVGIDDSEAAVGVIDDGLVCGIIILIFVMP